MASMKQFMVMVTELERARLDALRITTGVSRSEVNRQLMAIALPIAERQNAARLARLSAVAGAAGYLDVAGFVNALVEQPEHRQKTPTLEELEAEYLSAERGGAQDIGGPDTKLPNAAEQELGVAHLAESLSEA